MNKKLAPIRAKNDVTHALQLKLHERMNKTRFDVAVTSYVTKLKKKQEKANNSPRYRCAAVKKMQVLFLKKW